jgi:pimeloyl-ACP methyl ester carboxylesterase
VEVGGATVRGEKLGEGPPVLLVHGWGGRGAQLANLARPLLDAGCSAVAFDGPAHGASSGGTTSLVRMAGAIAAVARRFRARAAVGHSFGGAALGLAIARGLELDAVALVGAPASPVGFFGDFCDAFDIPARARPGLVRRLERIVGVELASLDARRLAPAIGVPALVVHDAEDREIPFSEGEAIAGAWPGARLVRTEGLGHRRILRDPAVADVIAAFLAGRIARCGCGRLAVGEAAGEPRCATCLLSVYMADRGGRAKRASGSRPRAHGREDSGMEPSGLWQQA